MKKLLWTSALALTAMACLTACDESGTDSGLSIAEYKTASALPDTCSMEVAKVDTTYFACQENKWIEVTDSATVEKIKEGIEESDLQEVLEEMAEVLPTPDKKQSSSSSKKVESSADKGSVEPESSASEEECTGRRCGSSSSKKKDSSSGSGSTTPSSTGSAGSGSGSSTGSAGSGSGSSTGSAGSGSGSSTGSAGSGSGSSSSGPTVSKCGDEFINEKDYFCYKDTKYERCNGESYIPDGDSPEKCILSGTTKVVATYCYINTDGDSIFYNKKTQFCTGAATPLLCGGKSYDYKNTEFCFKDNIGTYCAGSVYDPATEVCKSNTVYGICGSSTIDYSTQQCVGSTPSNLPDGATYTVTYEGYDPSAKVTAIKSVQSQLGLGLMDAKSFVENAPSVAKEGLTLSAAITLKNTFAENGGVSSITAVGGCPAYNAATEFCYKGVVYELCGGKEYKPTTQECKAGEIINLSCVADVFLVSYGAAHIPVIKVVKEKMNLGLTDAKNLTDAAPTTLVEAWPIEDANDFVEALIDAGGTAELRNNSCAK